MELLRILISLALVNNLEAVMDLTIKMNQDKVLFMLAEPERGITSEPMSAKVARDKLRFQHKVRRKTNRRARVIAPSQPDLSEYNGWSMSAVGNERKHIVSVAVKHLIGLLTNGTSTPEFRIDMKAFHCLCRTIGLHKALENPDEFIKVVDAEVKDDNCLITYANRNVSRYRYVGNTIFEFNADGSKFESPAFTVTPLLNQE